MKKVQKISCAFLALVCCVLLLSGCDGGGYTKEIQTIFQPTGEILKIAFYSPKSFEGDFHFSGTYPFKSENSPAEMLEKMQKYNDFHGEVVNDCIFITQERDGQKECFCINRRGEDWYQFSGMKGTLVTDVQKDGEKTVQAFLLPVHLLADERITCGLFFETYPKVEYGAYAGIDAFYDFYRESGWYTVEKTEDTLTLTAYLGDPAISKEMEEKYNGNGSWIIEKPITFHFFEEQGKNFFGITVG